jgi:uncharacterized delta-60 repeat protein
MNKRLLLSLACGLLAAPAATAEIITVSPWHTAGNGVYTDAFGAFYTVPNVVAYHRAKDAFGAGPDTNQLVIHSLGFSDLQGVSYTGQPVANLSIQPVPGWTGGVSFYGFDLGVWQTPPLQRDVDYEIWNGDFSIKLASGTVNVGAVRATVNVALFSPNGFNVQFESAGFVAIDNYRVEGNDGASPKPFIALSGNGIGIANGDTTPELADHTDFGSGAGTRAFTITNSGPLSLNLTGTAPTYITLSGSADFSITSQPSTPVASNGGTTSFSIAFNPSSSGVKTATVSIASDDTSRTPFTFRVSGYTAGISNGSLDTTFSSDGIAINDFGNNSNDYGRAVAIQPDGKILVAGTSFVSGSNQYALARYSTNGTLDPSFGTGGFVFTDVGPQTDEAVSVLIQPDGNIVLAGHIQSGTGFDFALVRYTPTGTLDPSFGSAGKVITTLTGSDEIAAGAVLQPDGKIIVAGSISVSLGYDITLVRYTDSGAIDTSFGSSGRVITSIGNSYDTATSIALQSDGNIIVGGGKLNPGIGNDFAALRYTSTGTLDTTFGVGGIVVVALSAGGPDLVNAITLQQDGRIILAGFAQVNGNTDFAIVRLTATGNLDPTFGTGGIVFTPVGPSLDYARGVAVQPDGKIVVAGTGDFPPNYSADFAIARYTITGALDSSFGTAGIVITALSPSFENAAAVALQSDGRIVVAGNAYYPVSQNDFAVAVFGPLRPDIAVAEGSALTDGGSFAFGATIPGLAVTPVTFTITNPGAADLSSLAAVKSGGDAADFIVGNLSTTSIPVGAGTATFTVTFSPNTTGIKTATIQISSNVAGTKNPFDINLTGNALSYAVDSDGDGLNDASEFQMAAMGFNWQEGQTSLVNTYFNAAASAGLFTSSQIQTQHPGAALVPRDPDTGGFKLTLGVERSTTLEPHSFMHFPLSEPQVDIHDGIFEFRFTSPDPAAFFRLTAE